MSACSSAVDERERVADRREQDVAAGLVGLGLERDAQAVALLLDVRGDGVDALGVAVVRGVEVLGGVVLGALAAAPHDERVGAQLGGEVDVADDLAQAVAAHAAVVRRERAVLEDRVAERVGGDHLDGDAGLVERALEAGEDLVALGVVRAEGDDVVVVERHVRGAQLGELVDRLDRVQPRARGRAELVLGVPADRPEAERELVCTGGLRCHHASPHRDESGLVCRMNLSREAGRVKRMPQPEPRDPSRVARQAQMRDQNLGVALRGIVDAAQPPSRAQLAASEGLARATVSGLVDHLIEARLVRELDPHADAARGPSGRAAGPRAGDRRGRRHGGQRRLPRRPRDRPRGGRAGRARRARRPARRRPRRPSSTASPRSSAP